MIKKINKHIHPVVFYTSSLLVIFTLFYGVIATEQLSETIKYLHREIVTKFGWFYILSVASFLIFSIWLMLSRFGHVRLGKNNEKPQYGFFAWMSMLFSAGMGIGLIFYGVAEPIMHFASPPTMEGSTVEAAKEAMRITFFHWGVHAWAIYALVGCALAYFAFRKDRPLTIRTLLYPVFGDKINGRVGDAIDILATLGTLFGVATSLGLGVMQVNAGLAHVFDVEQSIQVQILLISGITLLATISVALGLDRGILLLSKFNILAAGLLLCFVFLAGPSIGILNSLVQNIGHYLQYIPEASFWTAAYSKPEWLRGWTVFYWAWWIAWSPFVGMFIARISRGRTIREFTMGVLFIPASVTFLWMTTFGDTAIHFELDGIVSMTQAVSDNVPVALFTFLEHLPWSAVTSCMAMVVIVTFFVTSSDSGSYVIDIITSGGKLEAPVWQRIFWAVLEGFVAAVLLLCGGLKALQTAAIATALPFCLVLILVMIGLVKMLKKEKVNISVS